ncbi:hypothetical protein [Methylobacterium mesophilicum]|nr:hypothetical protein [Methylobacterium mesophilicum]
MSAYDVVKDFAGPVATICAAVAATSITGLFAAKQWQTAYMQAQIALDKLKIDTFGDRMAVLKATRSLMRLVVSTRSGEVPDLHKMQELRRTIDDGRFLFNSEIRLYLNNIVNTCYDVINFTPNLTGQALTEDQHKELIKRTEATKTIIQEMRRLPEILEK